jgi:histidyl-tRNA synthetase
VGWALGVERVLELLKEQGSASAPVCLDAYAVIPDVTALPVAIATLERLRAHGVSVQMHGAPASGEGMGSMKSQFKKADTSGARHALVFGSDELARGMVLCKSLRDGNGSQIEHCLDNVSEWASALQFSS